MLPMLMSVSSAGVLDSTSRAAGGVLPAWFQPERRELLSSAYRHLYVADGVVNAAAAARAAFDKRFANPRDAHPERFSWDFWHVTHREEDHPRSRVSTGETARGQGTEAADAADYDSLSAATSAAASAESGGYGRASSEGSKAHGSGQQYTMLRTSAASFFEPELFDELCTQLTEYGREQLGCDAITPPWLALYTDGCSQNFHTDAPHGPFAFVLSLTPDGAYAPQDGTVRRERSPMQPRCGAKLLLRIPRCRPGARRSCVSRRNPGGSRAARPRS